MVLSDKFSKNQTTCSKDIAQTRKCHRTFSYFTEMHICKLGQGHQIKSVFLLCPNNIFFGNLVRIKRLVHKILCRQKVSCRGHKCHRTISFSIALTLNIRSRSQKSYQFFLMSQLYILESLVRIQLTFTR